MSPFKPVSALLSSALSARERQSLRRALTLLHLNRSSFALAVLVGTVVTLVSVLRSGVAAWLIARAY